MLRGSVKAPPSARRSEAFGLLEAASEGQIRRWVALLQQSGALVVTETDDGFKVLRANPEAPHPVLEVKPAGRAARQSGRRSDDRRAPGEADGRGKGLREAGNGRRQVADDSDPIVARLRSWRSSRSTEDGVPAYVILHDATLHELSRLRPSTPSELADIRGLGPAKVERYGAAILEVIGTAG
jgi:superfamily II DNA helicase RecQ